MVMFFWKKISITDKMFFAQYLSLMLRSGITLTRALDFLVAQMSNLRMKEVAASLSRDITTGMGVAQSFAKYPDVFDELFVSMVSSGEAAGNLEEVLDVISEELRKSAELRSKVIGALIYPAIIVTMMILVSIFIVFFVFPRIIKVYESLRVKVPLLTKLFIAIVQFLVANAYYILGALILIIAALVIFARLPKGKRTFHWLWIHLPVIKTLNMKINVVQFSRTLASLLKSGIALPQAFEITSRTFQNSFYRESVAAMATGIREGKRASDLVMQYSLLYPPVVGQMMGVGEETGRLTEILQQLARFYEQEVDLMLNNLSKIIEPILMLLIGGGVGLIAVATVQLIYASLRGIVQ
jgi:type IV pilus assembly protein PilC